MAKQRNQLTGSRPDLRVDEQILLVAGAGDRPVLDALCAHPRGQLAVQGSQALRLFGLTLGLFPDARMLIPVVPQEKAQWLCRELGQVTTSPVRLFGSTPQVPQAHCTVCTFGDVKRLRSRYDVVLLGDAESATEQQLRSSLEHLACPRVYRFYPVGQQLDGDQQAWLAATVGPVIYRSQADLATVRVLFLPAPPFRTKSAWNALERKRKAIWHHKGRNRRIAAVALALTAGDTAAIRGCGLAPDQVAAPTAIPGRRAVIILVESVEHGRQLQSYLPGAALLHLAADSAGEPETATPPAWAKPVLVTVSYAVQHPLEADVLIRATGARGGLAINGANTHQFATVERDCLLIDLDDGWDRHAEADTEDRRRHYRVWGWQVETLQAGPL